MRSGCHIEESVPDALGRQVFLCKQPPRVLRDDGGDLGNENDEAQLAAARRHFLSDGVLARVWAAEEDCFWYATRTDEALRRCARREASVRLGAASLLRWDVSAPFLVESNPSSCVCVCV